MCSLQGINSIFSKLRFGLVLAFLIITNLLFAQQASNVVVTWPVNNQLQITWTKGSATSLVVVYPSNSTLTPPSFGGIYSGSSTYGAGSALGTGFVVYDGTGTSVTVTNVIRCNTTCIANGGTAPIAVYTVKVYDYSFSGSPLFKNIYNIGDAFKNPANSQGLSPEPSQATGLSVSAVTQTSMTLSCTPGSGTARMFLVYSGPLDMNASTNGWDGVDFGSCGSAYGICAVSGVGYIVSSSSATSVNVTGLTPGTTFYAAALDYYDVSGLARNYNINLSPSNTITQVIISADPTLQATSSVSNSSFNMNWVAASGATNYYIDVSTDSYATYIHNNLSIGNVSSYPLTGLSANTLYYYRVRSSNAGGTSASTANTQTTAPAPPTFNAATGVNNTSFTANWNASTAANAYFLDVSAASNFSPLIAAYSNVAVGNVTTYAVNTLSPNTAYYYRVRSKNANGTSVSSSTGNITTAPASPTASSSLVLDNSFSANWTASAGANNYLLDVSTVSNFSSFVPGYNNFSAGNVSSTTVSGLAANTQYFFRVRAVGATGTSTSSLNASVTTGPPPPVAVAATSVGVNTFTANWNSSVSATSYTIDVSTVSDFATLLSGYSSKVVSGNNEIVEGLVSGSIYYYRLRSSNTSGTSNYSNVIVQVTTPPAPVAAPVTSKATTSFTASWQAVANVTGYELDISTDINNFDSFVAGYEAKSIPANKTQEFVTGLAPGTYYAFRVRAVNAGGTSADSDIKFMQTDGSPEPFSISVTTPDNTLFSETTTAIVGNASHGLGTVKGNIIYKGVAAPASSQQQIPFTGTDFSVPVTDDMLDELGMEFTVEVQDNTETKKVSSTQRIYRQFNAKPLVGLESGFNGDPSGYKMFSIPADLPSKRIDEIFQPVISQFGDDKSKWILLRYNTGKQGYDKFPDLTTIEPGKGYWFNAIENPPAILITASVIKAHDTAPFQVTVEQGWNQIGNPYPFNIKWSDIQTENTSVGLNSLWTFESGNYGKKTALLPWKGAFVFCENAGVVTFPVDSKTSDAGRETDATVSNDENNWQIPFQLELNGIIHEGAVGMSPTASTSKDRFDEIETPRFIDYLEMHTVHNEFFAPDFAFDVVPVASHYQWTFDLASSEGDGMASISWDNNMISTAASMLLIDLNEQTWIDMNANRQYSFKWRANKKIRIVYSTDGPADAGISMMGYAYPNPFAGKVSIPVLLNDGETYAEVHVYDMVGRRVRTISQQFDGPGSQVVAWDGLDDNGAEASAGMYVYRLTTTAVRSQSRLVTKQTSR